HGTGRGAALRRTGHEERRRVRCLAAAVRLAWHFSAPLRDLTQGAATAAPGRDAASRARRSGGGGGIQPVGGSPPAGERRCLVAGERVGAVVGCTGSGASRTRADRGRSRGGIPCGTLLERSAALSA